MDAANDVIERIVQSCQAPSERKRREIVRELRGHLEDFAIIAREAGHSEDEVGRLIAENFGDPKEIAKQFATVYRLERIVLRLSVFLLATLAATSFIWTVVLCLQASVAFGLGVPVSRVLGTHHLKLESLYLFATVAAYVGMLTLEKLFDDARFRKALGLLGLVFSCTAFALATVDIPAGILGAAFVSGTLLRAAQVFLKSRAAQIATATAFFGFFGALSACRQFQAVGNEAAIQLIVWLAIGMCGHMITNVSGRVERALSNGLQQT